MEGKIIINQSPPP